jgi:hypothetical protein
MQIKPWVVVPSVPPATTPGVMPYPPSTNPFTIYGSDTAITAGSATGIIPTKWVAGHV